MIPLLNLPDILLLAILVKLNSCSFSRTFRTNKTLQLFLKETRKKFQIRVENSLYIDLSADSKNILVDIKTTVKTRKTCTFVVDSEQFGDLLCYFKFDFLSLRTNNNKVVPELCSVKAVELFAYWNEDTSHVLRMTRPTSMMLKEQREKSEVDEFDLDLLKELKLEKVRYFNGCYTHLNKAEYLISTCSSYVNEIYIDKISGRALENSVRILLEKLIAEEARFEYLCIANCENKIINMKLLCDNCEELHNCEKGRSHNLKLHLWMVPLREGKFILVGQYRYVFSCRRSSYEERAMPLHVLLVKDRESLNSNTSAFTWIVDREKVWNAASAQLPP